MRAAVAIAVVAACAGTPPVAPTGAPAGMTATRAGSDDEIVAQVNGRPVWASCVAIQAARAHKPSGDRAARLRAATDECIAFELLAQAAERRQLASDPEVALATRTALVNAVLANEWETKFTTREAFGPAWDPLVARNMEFVSHPEARASAYVRVVVPEHAPTEQDAAAHDIAEKIAVALAPEQGLMDPQFFELAQRAAEGHPLFHQAGPPFYANEIHLDAMYAKALFEISDIGRTTPHAVRTSLGWDVILWTYDVPAAAPTPAEIEADMMPGVQHVYFAKWVDDVAKRAGIHHELIDDNLKWLDQSAPPFGGAAGRGQAPTVGQEPPR